jgi:TonB-linked SusC/RagA family outer membrane protein
MEREFKNVLQVCWKTALFTLFFTGILLFSQTLQAQIQVKGKITDAQGKTLPGANVIVAGTTTGTVTGVDGSYSITVPGERAELQFSFIGYESQKVTVGKQTVINVTLTEETTTLNEMVVVGYGIQKKANLTGAVTSIRSNDLLKRQVAQASNLIQGLAPGVTVQQQSGKPGGDGASIRIRGMSSIYAGQSPLIMVDGVVGSLDNLDPNTIESVSILKDAASTAIYGSRAANGVMLIRTKRAEAKGIKMSYNSFVTKQVATAIPERTTAIEHMELSNAAEQNRTGNPAAFLYAQTLIDKYKTTKPNNLDVIDTDWLKEVLSNSGLMHSHNLSLSSGGEVANIYASVSYMNQQGLIQHNSFDRYDLRLNPDFKIRKNLTLSGIVRYTVTNSITPSTSSPEFIIRQAVGLPAVGGGKYGPGKYGTAGQTNNRNPLAQAEAAGTSYSKTGSFFSKAAINYKPFEDLEVEAFWAREQWLPHGKSWVKNVDIYTPNVTTGSYDKIAQWPGTTSLGESYSTNTRNTYLAQATYTLELNDHTVKFLAGAQTEEFIYEGISASRTGFINPNQPYLNLGASNYANAGSSYETALAGFYSRLNYNFRDKYLIEMNARYDGSSRFSQALDKQWGFFPSASAGWVFSNEGFFSGLKNIVSFGKLRASYGILGNQSLPEVYPFAVNFSTRTYSNPYNGTSTYFDNVTTLGYQLSEAPNPDITWEKSKQLNFGLDLNLLAGINVTYDYYVRTLNDMLLRRPIPDYVGLTAPFVNIGAMENKGWELSLNYQTSIDKLKINATAMLSDVVNKITDIGGLPYLDGGSVRTYKGESLWSYYGYKSLGYFQSKEDIQGSPVQFGVAWNDAPNVGPKPGDVKYADISGVDGKPDGKVDANDRTLIGNSFPRYEYSFNLNLSYRGFDMNVFGQGVGKRNNYLSGTGAVPFASSDFAASLLKLHKDYWTAENPDALFPRLLPAGSGGNNFVTSSHWIKSAAYFRIKNVNLGYHIPDRIFGRSGITGARIYISAQNLLTFTKAWDGFDPEIDNANAEFYPLMKTYTLGLNINF